MDGLVGYGEAYVSQNQVTTSGVTSLKLRMRARCNRFSELLFIKFVFRGRILVFRCSFQAKVPDMPSRLFKVTSTHTKQTLRTSNPA